MPIVLVTVAMQAVGLLGVLVGVALLLPFAAALLVDGLLVVALGVAVEHIALRRPAAPSVRRDGAIGPGVD